MQVYFKIILSLFLVLTAIDRIKSNSRATSIKINKDPFYVIKKKIPCNRKLDNIFIAIAHLAFIGGIWYYL